MAVDLFSFVGMYSKAAATASHILDRGLAFAASKGVTEAEMLEWRLAPDMFPLRRQLMVPADLPMVWMALALGEPAPATLEGEPTAAEIRAALAGTQAYLAGLKAEQFAGRDDVPVTFDLGQIAPTFPVSQWITGFVTTNLLFHLSIAYAILRHQGLDLGKRDLFAGGL